MPSLSLSRKLTVLILKHPSLVHNKTSQWLIRNLMKDYQRLTAGSPSKNQQQ